MDSIGREELELRKLVAETVKLQQEVAWMVLRHRIDKIKVALTGIGAVAAVLTALKLLGWIGGA